MQIANSFIDTHCHIHDDEYGLDAEAAYQNAMRAGVSKLICVGTDAKFSQQAISFAENHKNTWASVGLHPHDALPKSSDLEIIKKLASNEIVVAIGECGLDYYYQNSDKDSQKAALKAQLDLAVALKLPLIFHIRGSKDNPSDAFNDFWNIFDKYKNIRGVVHSFTGETSILDQIIKRKLYVGLNGIITFTKDPAQLAMARSVPLDSLLLETDSPFLTPSPFRGTINEPKNVVHTAEFLASLRSPETIGELCNATTLNAETLFGL